MSVLYKPTVGTTPGRSTVYIIGILRYSMSVFGLGQSPISRKVCISLNQDELYIHLILQYLELADRFPVEWQPLPFETE